MNRVPIVTRWLPTVNFGVSPYARSVCSLWTACKAQRTPPSSTPAAVAANNAHFSIVKIAAAEVTHTIIGVASVSPAYVQASDTNRMFSDTSATAAPTGNYTRPLCGD